MEITVTLFDCLENGTGRTVPSHQVAAVRAGGMVSIVFYPNTYNACVQGWTMSKEDAAHFATCLLEATEGLDVCP